MFDDALQMAPDGPGLHRRPGPQFGGPLGGMLGSLSFMPGMNPAQALLGPPSNFIGLLQQLMQGQNAQAAPMAGGAPPAPGGPPPSTGQFNGAPGFGPTMAQAGMPSPGMPGPGVPSASGAVAGGRPGGSTAVDPTDLIRNPSAAIQRELSRRGIDPGTNYHPYVQGLMKRASEGVHSAIGSSMLGGDGSNLGTMEGIQQLISSFVDQALRGGKVFGGFSSGDVGRIGGMLEAPEAQQNPGLLNMIQALSGDDQRGTAGFLSSLLYGGMSEPMQRTMSAPLLSAAQRFQQGLEEGAPGTELGSTGNLNLIAALLGVNPPTAFQQQVRGSTYPGLLR